MFSKIRPVSILLLSLASAFSSAANAGVERRIFTYANSNQITKIEWLADGLIHFEFTHGIERKTSEPIYSSVLINQQSFSGPGTFLEKNNTFTTAETRTDYADGCFSVFDLAAKKLVANICPQNLGENWKQLKLNTSGVRNIYGLGQMFTSPGDTTSDRNGKIMATKGGYGNSMPSYGGGATGEAMFPVVTALGTGRDAWTFVLDNVYKQTWDFTKPTWTIGMFGDQIRGYIITGGAPKEVRRRLMNLTGHAPVPPRKMFGFWMSEYGYDNWDEIKSRLGGMRRDGFPIDGFFLDLQWFGNVAPGSDHTRMGSLEFDDRSFPSAGETIQSFYRNEDIGLITIEESYVGRALPEHDQLESRGFLAHECGHPTSASYLTGDVTGNSSEWWGRGGMIDWSNPLAGQFWHNLKRQKLVDLGIFAHWLDLGEPEMFDARSCYFGNGESNKNAHQDIHNLFSLYWAKSLWDGFAENKVTHRPFAMLRSGNIGLQRFGAGMWSGDIGGNLQSLASHIASHSQVSWSGIDYYSSDVGGFHRNRVDGRPLSFAETQENFTQWFANAAWFDVPFRSHVMNLDNDRDTAPNKIGHVESNRLNLLTRYSLVPYYYSLAHLAANTGSPLMEPLAMRFPEDTAVRSMGDQRMLGDLMIASTAATGIYQRNLYLPPGLWYDFYDGQFNVSSGESIFGFPTYRDGIVKVPVFAKAGAIIPRYIGPMNNRALGDTNAAILSKDMLLDVYIDDSSETHRFEFVEDDGYSRNYESGATRVSVFEQQTNDLTSTIWLKGAVGTYSGAEQDRSWTVRLRSPGWTMKNVRLGDQLISECTLANIRRVTSPCYAKASGFSVIILIPPGDVRLNKKISIDWSTGQERKADIHFVCDEGRDAPRSYGMFVVGNIAPLGSWNPNFAIPLRSAEYSRGIWTGMIRDLPLNQSVEWKCVRKIPGGGDRNIEWQPGSNNTFSTSGSGGFSGMAMAKW